MDSELKRKLTLPLITFYGVGTILGAGIYVLIGEVAGKAGLFTPLSFIAASIIATFSAFSFAELSSRYPKSAGEAVYVQQAFNNKVLSLAVGLAVVSIAIISSAAIIRGFTGYLNVFIQIGDSYAIILLTVLLCGVAVWGIVESVIIISCISILEIGGLLMIIWVGGDSLAELPARFSTLFMPQTIENWTGIFAGAILAFYAFIGFEDMVNVAEEVKQPRKNLPLAIILALIVTTLLYLAVSLVAVLSMPLDELSISKAPLASIYQHETGGAPTVISLISIVAVTNGALVQIIMGARVLYGLSSQGWLPAVFSRVNSRTGTPMWATISISLVIVVMSLWFPLVTLAHMTSMITLTLFFVINCSLLIIKKRDAGTAAQVQLVPVWIPIIGICTTGCMLIIELYNRLIAWL